MAAQFTPIESIPKIVAASCASFRSHRTLSLEFRKEQLRALERCLTENEAEFKAAIKADLNRPSDFEIPTCIKVCKSFISNLDVMAQNQKAAGVKESDECYVRYSPLGSVLIIGTWNFPIMLLIEPLVGAIAAGNTCIVKPSEVAEHCAEILARRLPQYLDPQVVSVITGGVDETTALLKERFDHIFYTGSTEVGKVIMAAAAKHLTPVTLELGGKCPTIITENTDIAKAAQRIAHWKSMNCGQVCISVDYIICPKHLQEELIKNVIGYWHHLFGKDLRTSENYPRIINKRQFERLEKLLKAVKEQSKVVFGGRTDAENLFIEPTIATDVSLSDEIMKGEIFGPILPIITCEDLEGAIEIVNKMEHSLNLNLFSTNQEQIDKVLRETRSGSVSINDVASAYSNHSLPFGGVGSSGVGNYHGKYSFDTFSHKRAVMIRNLSHL
ncbi:aldehyde dehydrogenase isozyme 3 [Dissophora ornata]|nr:Aldehyde dehydrogenase, dimeric NADP-preferring [Dissophora ornata]KAI8601811.1 aldehyde dehydrogenase isozyme 3 [Dissophora ornata]